MTVPRRQTESMSVRPAMLTGILGPVRIRLAKFRSPRDGGSPREPEGTNCTSGQPGKCKTGRHSGRNELH